jgi:hypothetical protein
MIRSPPLIIPSVNDIRFAPDRASLVILQAALIVAARAIAAEHPSVMSCDDPRIFDPSTLARARELIDRFNALTESLERYFAAVDDLIEPNQAAHDESIF